jgi:hypothetical protein
MGSRYERHRVETWLVRQQAELLSTQQRELLERDGYLLVPSLLDGTVLGPIASRLEELVRQTVAAWDADPSPAIAEPGVVRAKLDRADPDFALCCEHPLLSDAAAAVLGPTWYLAALSLRAPLPGCGHQGCIPTSKSAGSPGRGRRYRPCGASPRSLPITGRCGSSPVRTGSGSRPSTCWRSDRRWARTRTR